jgi:hypothetical protein
MVDTRALTNSGVGDASSVGITVGVAVSIAEVAMTVGGIFVGSAVEVVSITGTAAVQAVRRSKKTMLNFFM